MEAKNLVIPQKYGNVKKPTVIYSWKQVLIIKAIDYLRETISLDITKQIINFLYESGVKDKHLVFVKDKVYWAETDWSNMPGIMRDAAKDNKGIRELLIVIIPSISSVVDDVWKAAEESSIINFESFKQRAEDKPSGANDE